MPSMYNHSKVLVDYMLDTKNGMEKSKHINLPTALEDDQDNIDEILNTQKSSTPLQP